jgi:hypothetical protein
MNGFVDSTGMSDQPKKIVQRARKQVEIPLVDLVTRLPDISTRHRYGD